MNKQNLLSSKYLLKYYISSFFETLLKFLIPIVLLFFMLSGYVKYLDSNIEMLNQELVIIEEDKEKYEETETMIKGLKETLNSNKEKLNYVQSLQGDFSKFDLLMSYLINMKPYDLAFISIEDLEVVPPPDQTSDIVSKDSISEILNGGKQEESEDIILSTSGDNIPVDNSSSDNTNDVIAGDKGDTWNSNKFDNSLIYTRDISLSNILIRGYGTNINSVAKYVDSVAKAPEIEGYTLEGVEDKITNIKDTNIILFEIKLKMKGVLENE